MLLEAIRRAGEITRPELAVASGYSHQSVHRICEDLLSRGLLELRVNCDWAEAPAMSDRVLVMRGGRIEQADDPETLYRRPRTAFVARVVGGGNVVGGVWGPRVAPGLRRVVTSVGPLDVACADDGTGEVSLRWRPEAAHSGRGPLAGEVVHRAFLGALTELTVAAGGQARRLALPHTDVREGEALRFHVAPEDVVLLSRAS